MTIDELHQQENNAFNQAHSGEAKKELTITHEIKQKPEKKTVKHLKFFTPFLELKPDHEILVVDKTKNERVKITKDSAHFILKQNKWAFMFKEYTIYDKRRNRTNISKSKITFKDEDFATVDFYYEWKIDDVYRFSKEVGNNLDAALNTIADTILSEAVKKAKNYASEEAYEQDVFEPEKNADGTLKVQATTKEIEVETLENVNDNLVKKNVQREIEVTKLIPIETIQRIYKRYGILITNLSTTDFHASPETAAKKKEVQQAKRTEKSEVAKAEARGKILQAQQPIKVQQQNYQNIVNMIRAQGEVAIDQMQLQTLIDSFPQLTPDQIANLYFQNKNARYGANISYFNMGQNNPFYPNGAQNNTQYNQYNNGQYQPQQPQQPQQPRGPQQQFGYNPNDVIDVTDYQDFDDFDIQPPAPTRRR